MKRCDAPRILVGAGIVAAAWLLTACSASQSDARSGDTERASAGPFVSITHGRYLAHAGDCEDCHTAKGGKPWAGGRAVPTPFGVIYSSNLTPDPATGIGNWSYQDFYRAMHRGVRRDGRRLYPAFPYPWFTKMSRQDVYDLKAYLDTRKPVHQRKPPNELPWPMNMRSVMAVWNGMYFDIGAFRSDSNQSDQWNRGAYLVRGVGHCGACHSSKNFAGASDMKQPFRGGIAEHVYAPDLTNDKRTGLGDWSVQDIADYLGTGSNAIASAAGPMAEVVEHSTQYLSRGDREAIGVYLKSVPGEHAGRRDHAADGRDAGVDDDTMGLGRAVYADNCTGCHMDAGKGLAGAFPALRDSTAIVVEKPQTLIQTVLQGARKPATSADPTALAMPGFGKHLNDAEVAAVLTYIRNSWGNHAPAVSADTVADLRGTLRRSPP